VTGAILHDRSNNITAGFLCKGMSLSTSHFIFILHARISDAKPGFGSLGHKLTYILLHSTGQITFLSLVATVTKFLTEQPDKWGLIPVVR
jgi:hypothetical protein